jgi:hypothetical protein
MSDLNDLLSSAAGTLSVHSAHSFTIFGSRHEAPGLEAGPDAESVLSPTARALLAEVLYAALHCRRTEGLSVPGDWFGARDFTHRLSAVNAGTTSWQPGWVIRGLEANGQIVAEKHGIRFWIPDDDFRPATSPPQVGGAGWVRIPKECCNLLPGFYLALGDAGEADRDGRETVRVYWHLWSGGAAPLVESLTSTLNRVGIPFALKLLANPSAYPRSDAAVLYVSPSAYQQLVSLLCCTYREIRPWLRPSVSAFAKPIAPGLAVAEDPGDGSSFGQHRCTLLVAELTRPEILSAGSGAERCRAVLTGLRRTGWDPERLYLNPGSLDRYTPLDPRELSAN